MPVTLLHIVIENQRHEYNNNGLFFKYKQSLPDLESGITWLDCPETLKDVKSTLLRAYQLESESIRLYGIDGVALSINYNNYDEILTVKNEFKTWFLAQQTRKEAYEHWNEILAKNGLKPAFVIKNN
jgi:hypothetical protein